MSALGASQQKSDTLLKIPDLGIYLYPKVLPHQVILFWVINCNHPIISKGIHYN